jgi:NADH-quinone oxidoreductase subunit M
VEHIPVLSIIIFLPIIFALINPLMPDNKPFLHFWNTLFAGILFLVAGFGWWTASSAKAHLVEYHEWLPQLGINYIVGADSLSWVLVLLTTLLVLMAVIASYTSVTKRLKLYYSMVFVLASAILGVFLARDLFVFVLFWELELIPMYLLIAIWGGPRREYAAIKFVLYTLFGSVFLLAATLGIFLLARESLGYSTFDFNQLSQTAQMGMATWAQILLFLGFFVAFAIKLPMVPFHTWLPDAHVEAPTPVSMLLAGILLKMGSYGMLRFCFGWFPEAAMILAPYLVLIGMINIVYTAGVAMVQTDLKKLIAYSSVSHMGFVLLGLGALNDIGFNGAVFQMVSHGLISAGLFMIVGTLYSRTHTRLIAEMGGFGKTLPTIFFFALIISLASLGLPLLAGFPAETLVFYGAFLSTAFKSIPWLWGYHLSLSIQTLTIISAIGVVLGAAYLLWMLQRVFMGPLFPKWEGLKDASLSETVVLGGLGFFIIFFGFFPNLVSGQFEAEVGAMASPYNKIVHVRALPTTATHLTPEKVATTTVNVPGFTQAAEGGHQ